jgi:hypothetical protein
MEEVKEQEKKYIEFKGQKIDTAIFEQGFVAGCDLNICHGQCCHAGVYMDREFKKVILDHKDMVIAVMDEHQVKDTEEWFDEEEVEDGDFPSGYAIGSAVYKDKKGNEKCVFNDERNFCSLQVAAVSNGMHKWAIKPIYCIMYPVTVSEGIFTYDDDHSEDLRYCGKSKTENFTQSAFDGTHEEIKYVMGEEFFLFLYEYYKTNYPEGFRKKEQSQVYQINIP